MAYTSGDSHKSKSTCRSMKRQFPYRAYAQSRAAVHNARYKLEGRKAFRAYKCRYCGAWHIGAPRA